MQIKRRHIFLPVGVKELKSFTTVGKAMETWAILEILGGIGIAKYSGKSSRKDNRIV